MGAEGIVDSIYDHVPEIILIFAGILAILIVWQYLKNDTRVRYKLLVALGVIFGAFIIFLSVTSYTEWNLPTAILIAIAGFTLIIRPFKEVHFAVIFALLVIVLVYIFLGQITQEPFDILATGWPRAILAFVAGALVYSILHFAEVVIKLFGKIFNCWPILLILGIICIAEAISILAGYGSLYGLVK
ncbi:MAG: hypothetical protein LBM39_03655 [Candidatus Methanoplasma sp.]|jgi:hypothetical protein|nr:hypothetical protein [Candidatus Methanoplasma sp.]